MNHVPSMSHQGTMKKGGDQGTLRRDAASLLNTDESDGNP